ncbi:MAG: cytochrome c3 family protein [Desulfobulbaceae bacterium]|nr:cytochrome c3 family protein [Desulfobulbaceae bacterium]
MFKKAIIVGVSVLSVAFAGAAFAADSMVLKGGSPGDVPFPHKAHQEKLGKDCDSCHKLFAKEAGSIEKAIAAGTLKKKEAMKACQDCHKAHKDKGEKTGPTSCKECHSKK